MLSLQYILIFLMLYLITFHILNFEKAREVLKINIVIIILLLLFDIGRQVYYGYQPVRRYDAIVIFMLVNGVGIYSFITVKKLITLFLIPVVYLVCTFINMVAAGFVFTLLGIDMYNLHLSSIHSLAGIASGVLLLVILYHIIVKLKIQLNVQTLTTGEAVFIIFFIGIFGFYVSNFYVFGNVRSSTLRGQIANLFALFSGVTGVYGILYLITKKNEMQGIKNSERQQLEIDEQQLFHYKKMEERDFELRSFRHDIKCELIALEALIKSKKTEKSLNYILQMRSELNDIISTTGTETGSIEINANLLAIESNSRFGGLKASWNGIIPSNLRIKSRDLSILFSNLLINSFEAASKVIDKGYVNVKIKTDTNLFRIQITNNFEGEIKKHPNGDFITSKQDHLNHGIGTKTIKRIVTSYNGLIKFEDSNGKFVVTIAFDGSIYER